MSKASEEDAILLTSYVSSLPDGATIVEIGTHRGSSALVMAEALPPDAHIYTIDHGGAVLFGIGELTRVSSTEATKKVEELYAFWPEYRHSLYDTFSEAGYGDKITPLFGSSHYEEWIETVPWPYGDIDLLFIDGDHCYSSIMSDILRWAPKVKLNGYMILHDYVGNFPSVPAAVEDYFNAHAGEWRMLDQSGLCQACQRIGEYRRR
jgi:hypothetical protein